MTKLDARYELGHRIGGGGMAEVVEAYDRKLDRRVAVKLLRNGSGDPRARERFVHEAQVAARLTHPNVVAVFDVGETDGQPYLVMELIDGQTLREVLDARGALPMDQALAAGDAVLAALGAAHAHGLVHRDVKPANVLISADGRVKLADFGIAKATQGAVAGLTATGQIIGTPTYLAPEQVEGAEATPRTDLYAVGVVLYEMLAGRPPFRADQALAVALAHRNDPVPPLEEHRRDLPAAVVAVVARALEKDPARRFADADEMRSALEAARNGRAGVGADATIAAAAPDVTRTLPSVGPAPDERPIASTGPRTRRRRSGRRSGTGVTIARFVAAAVIGAAAGLLIFQGEGGPIRAERAGVAIPPVAVSVNTLPTTTTTVPLPTTIDGLVAFLAGNPDAFGVRGRELLDRLVDLSDDPGRGRDAEHLARDVQQWVEDGELDPNIAALTFQILGVSLEDDGRGNGDD